jgi:hypothetical protein
MEYCPHCRAIRPTRKSSRRRNVRQADGSMKSVVTDSFHCTRCNAFVGSVDRDVTPTPAAAREAAPAEATPAASEEAVEIGTQEATM